MEMSDQHPAPAPLLPGKEHPLHPEEKVGLHNRLGRFGEEINLLTLPEIKTRLVQPAP
jgi:hypothetical protein